mmetsp:Transcript_13741/g.33831  ORF Transcript_13741/g.33831 Transcript_13741/m.33831 type:complete len:1045 (+) Transcript_13741:147-3281(+)
MPSGCRSDRAMWRLLSGAVLAATPVVPWTSAGDRNPFSKRPEEAEFTSAAEVRGPFHDVFPDEQADPRARPSRPIDARRERNVQQAEIPAFLEEEHQSRPTTLASERARPFAGGRFRHRSHMSAASTTSGRPQTRTAPDLPPTIRGEDGRLLRAAATASHAKLQAKSPMPHTGESLLQREQANGKKIIDWWTAQTTGDRDDAPVFTSPNHGGSDRQALDPLTIASAGNNDNFYGSAPHTTSDPYYNDNYNYQQDLTIASSAPTRDGGALNYWGDGPLNFYGGGPLFPLFYTLVGSIYAWWHNFWSVALGLRPPPFSSYEWRTAHEAASRLSNQSGGPCYAKIAEGQTCPVTSVDLGMSETVSDCMQKAFECQRHRCYGHSGTLSTASGLALPDTVVFGRPEYADSAYRCFLKKAADGCYGNLHDEPRFDVFMLTPCRRGLRKQQVCLTRMQSGRYCKAPMTFAGRAPNPAQCAVAIRNEGQLFTFGDFGPDTGGCYAVHTSAANGCPLGYDIDVHYDTFEITDCDLAPNVISFVWNVLCWLFWVVIVGLPLWCGSFCCYQCCCDVSHGQTPPFWSFFLDPPAAHGTGGRGKWTRYAPGGIGSWGRSSQQEDLVQRPFVVRPDGHLPAAVQLSPDCSEDEIDPSRTDRHGRRLRTGNPYAPRRPLPPDPATIGGAGFPDHHGLRRHQEVASSAAQQAARSGVTNNVANVQEATVSPGEVISSAAVVGSQARAAASQAPQAQAAASVAPQARVAASPAVPAHAAASTAGAGTRAVAPRPTAPASQQTAASPVTVTPAAAAPSVTPAAAVPVTPAAPVTVPPAAAAPSVTPAAAAPSVTPAAAVPVTPAASSRIPAGQDTRDGNSNVATPAAVEGAPRTKGRPKAEGETHHHDQHGKIVHEGGEDENVAEATSRTVAGGQFVPSVVGAAGAEGADAGSAVAPFPPADVGAAAGVEAPLPPSINVVAPAAATPTAGTAAAGVGSVNVEGNDGSAALEVGSNASDIPEDIASNASDAEMDALQNIPRRKQRRKHLRSPSPSHSPSPSPR